MSVLSGEFPTIADDRAISTIHNASSPLLRLPIELKLKIYALVLGGNTVHVTGASISRRSDIKRICQVPVGFDGDGKEYHETKPTCPVENGEGPHMTLDASLLETCKSVLEEARYMVFSHNTWIFQGYEAILEFINTLEKAVPNHKGHLSAIRSVRIDIYSLKYLNQSWLWPIDGLVLKCPKIEDLYLGLHCGLFEKSEKEFMQDVERLLIGKLAYLPLRRARVVYYTEMTFVDCQVCTLEERRKWFADMREKLLGEPPKILTQAERLLKWTPKESKARKAIKR